MQDIVATAGSIALGRTGENLVRRVVLPNIRDGTGTVVLLHQCSGGDAPYPVAVTEDGDKIYWVVTSVDKFVDAEGAVVTGTMADNGAISKTIDGLTAASAVIPAGYTSGGTVSLTGDIETALAAI